MGRTLVPSLRLVMNGERKLSTPRMDQAVLRRMWLMLSQTAETRK
ncbi:hypothetical protein PMI07_005369 [Rhizobium sp. CF080]|nr:hypothetical protein PMI07_005369 [Rhizobium sp. CF080]